MPRPHSVKIAAEPQHRGVERLDRLNIGAVKVTNVSGVVSTGFAYIRRSGTSGKGTVGGSAITGDCGIAPLYFGVLVDSDAVDAPFWWTVNGWGPA